MSEKSLHSHQGGEVDRLQLLPSHFANEDGGNSEATAIGDG